MCQQNQFSWVISVQNPMRSACGARIQSVPHSVFPQDLLDLALAGFLLHPDIFRREHHCEILRLPSDDLHHGDEREPHGIPGGHYMQQQ